LSETAERAVLVRASTEKNADIDSLEELEMLAVAADINVVGRLAQHLRRVSAATLLGKGKVEELAKLTIESPQEFQRWLDEDHSALGL